MSATNGNDTLTGTAGDDVIDLLAGNDSYEGMDGNDTIQGNNGDDIIYGGNGADSIDGGNGFDILSYLRNTSLQAISVDLGAGRAIDGLGGTDTISGFEVVSGGMGNDTLIGGNDSDNLNGYSGNDSVVGGLGNDSLDGFSGEDSLLGGDGNDRIYGGADNDSIHGGNGSDIAAYDLNSNSQGISVDLINGRANDGMGGTDTLSGIEYVWGGAGNDTIIGGNGADSFWGNSGNDSLVGGNGADTLDGSSGNDTIIGGDGNDRITAGLGSDSIDAGNGTFDAIRFDYTGAEAITATVTAVGGASGYNFATAATASQGNDTIINFEALNGSTNSDNFVITDAATSVANLFIFGNLGNDTISSSVALDRTGSGIFADYDALNAANPAVGFTRGVSVDLHIGNDTLGRPYGSATDHAGTDSLIGIRAVAGSVLNDTILGTSFDDRLRGYAGNDLLDGRGGLDMADYSNSATSRGISVNLAAQRASDGTEGTDTLISIENVFGGSGNDTIIGGNGDDSLRGGSGADRLTGGAGNDSIDGGDGSDILSFSANSSGQMVSVNLLDGRAGDGLGGTDTLTNIEHVIGGSGNDTLIGSAGADTLDGGDGSDSIIGGNSDDRLISSNGADFLDGGAGSLDYVDYSANGVGQDVSINFLEGRALDGLGFTDTLVGIEYIRAGAGADTMVGGNANDRFRGNAGNDSFDGGNGSEDILDLAQTTRPVSASLVTGVANDGLDGTDRFTNVEVVYSGTASDTLIGGSGNDIFDGGMSGDLIDGGLGADRVRYNIVSGSNGSITRGVSVDLAAQRATDGWGGADTLVGIERVTATNFADTLLGNNVSNRFSGLAGNDSIDGGLASDWLEYTDSAATSGVTVNLTTGTASDGRGGTDSLTSIENVIGSTFGDHLTGTAQLGRATSRLRGAAGSDTLVGIDGEFVVADYADQTVGLSVNLASGSVNDGLGGVDSLVNIRGAMMFGNHADTLIGTSSMNWLAPSGGNDSIVGGSDTDILDYDGNPTGGVSVNLTSRTASDGDGGTDFFTGIEAVKTGYSNDTVIGDNGDNFISLGAGADSADAAGGRDFISYAIGSAPNTSVYTFNEAGNQLPFTGVTIDLTAGRATDYGGSIDTILNFEDAEGSTMHDSILGSSGDNELEGWDGNDTINAGAGNDTIWGDAGNDLFMGGAGNDLYLMGFATGRVIIDDASGNDTVDFGGVAGREIFASDISSLAGIEAFDLVGSGNTLHLTAARALSVSGTGLFRVFGGGADRIIFDDTGWVRTGSSGGSDTLSNSAGNATVIASTGLVSSDIGSVVNGGDGNDTLGGGNGADTIDGGNGSDLIAGLGGSDSILGGDGNDAISGGDGADTVLGGLGNDSILGGNGNDSLSGGDGHDTLNGGNPAGGLDDTLTGGAGNDLYIAPEAVVFDTGGSDTVSMLGGGVATISASAGDLDGNPGIEAIDVAGSGRLLGLTRAAVISVSDTDVLRVFGSGADRLVFEDTGWTSGASSGGFVTFTNGGATVIAAESLVSVVSGPTTGNDTLSGTSGADTIDLLAGSDSYLGLDGDDVIQGNNGADTIYGGNGADSIAGGNDDDVIFGEAGSDTIDAGAGISDSIRYNQTGGEAITAIITSSGGNTGINTATVSTATQGTDSIQGFEALSGSNNGDRITVTTAATQNNLLFLFGGAGNDTIIDSYRAGSVFADYNTSDPGLTIGISVDLASGIATDGFGGTDSLVGITAVRGTSFADTILGSASNDRLRGLQGNDLLDGRGGTGDIADYTPNAASQAVSVNLADGLANDGIGMLVGSNTIFGTDTLISIEQARGGAGNDVLIGDSNNNTFRGNAGNDTINGAGGTGDAADYGFATAAVTVNLGTGQAQDGQGGNDSLVGIENVFGSAFGDMLIGGALNDNLRGNAGNDTINGAGGTFDTGDYSAATAAVTVNLGTGEAQDGQGGVDSLAGIEVVWGSAYADTLIGGNGNDNLRGNAGHDTLDGGAGTADVAQYASATTGITVNLGTGIVQDGQGGTDILAGIEQIWGSSFNDSMLGGNGADFFVGSTGADTFDGGLGVDAVSYSFYPTSTLGSPTQGVSVDLATGTGRDAFGGLDRLSGIEIIYASSFADTITGGGANETIYGNGGADSLIGGNGNDLLNVFGSSQAVRLEGGEGDDELFDGSGADTMSGGAGNDCIYSTAGADSVNGGDGDDNIDAGGSLVAVRLDGGAGHDTLYAGFVTGGSGGSTLSGGTGNDILNVGQYGGHSLSGDGGNDVLTGSSGNETMSGGDDADTIYGNAGNDSLDGGAGDDQVYANGASNMLGGEGNDQLFGGNGAETILGGNGADTIYGGNGNGADSIQGGDGNDLLSGEGGNDTIATGTGTDNVVGGDGNDLIIVLGDGSFAGQTGTDTLQFAGTGRIITDAALASSSGIEVINLAGGGNTLNLSAARVLALSGTATLQVFGAGTDSLAFSDEGWVRGAPSGGFVTFTNGGTTVIAAQSLVPVPTVPTTGNDTLTGTAGNDVIDLLAGNDSYLGLAGADSVLGNAGADTLDGGLNDPGNDSLSGGEGNDVLYGWQGSNLLIGGNGDDSLYAYQTGNSTFLGDDGNDLLSGGDEADTAAGGNGNDFLYGNGGADSLNGGAGADTFHGGTGNDTLIGGDGTDSLVGAEGNDVYFVSDTLDQIIETSGGGADTVTSSVSISMPDQVEALQIAAGVTGITLTGGAGNDMLVGNGLANNINGGAGDDVILAGNVTLADIYALFGP